MIGGDLIGMWILFGFMALFPSIYILLKGSERK